MIYFDFFQNLKLSKQFHKTKLFFFLRVTTQNRTCCDPKLQLK
jgi:hypothetical protein